MLRWRRKIKQWHHGLFTKPNKNGEKKRENIYNKKKR